MAASGATGPPTKTTGGSAASGPHAGRAPPRAVSVGRLRTTPRAPSALCSRTSTTVRSKFGSCIVGLATSSRPFSGAVSTPRCWRGGGLYLVSAGVEGVEMAGHPVRRAPKSLFEGHLRRPARPFARPAVVAQEALDLAAGRAQALLVGDDLGVAAADGDEELGQVADR